MYSSLYRLTLLLGIYFLLFTTSTAQTVDSNQKRKAVLLEGMGTHSFSITTDTGLAQRYFDQGLSLTYGFNHGEAERAFREAARLDPNCAMAYWGIALVQGPDINVGMSPDDNPKAYQAVQKAVELSDRVTAKERALIMALSQRYEKNPPEDRSSLDKAYAEAMRDVAANYPNDPDVLAMLGEALMVLHPWNYWKEDGSPQPWTPEILETLEQAIDRKPEHPGANHYYIHTVEASPKPERGLQSANRMRHLVPGAGHLTHMPSHIYIRTGKYHEGSLANERAIEADQRYLEQVREQGIYPLGYVPHNYHFLWATATMEGRSRRAIEAATAMAEKIDREMMRDPGMGTLQHYYATPLYALTRFGKWDRILDEPEPTGDLLYPMGVYHYARGSALAGKGQLDQAERELQKLQKIANRDTLEQITIWDINTTGHLLRIAGKVLDGHIDYKKGNLPSAVKKLRRAVELEDQLNYDEPPPWHFPVRHALGAVLLENNQPREAEKVYRKNLLQFPKNGWALFGLWQSLRKQGKSHAARDAKRRFDIAWSWADIDLTSSVFF